MYFDFCKPSEDEAVSCNNRDRDCGRAMFASSMAKKFFNTDLLMKMLEDHRDGKNTNEKTDDSRKIWTVYIFLVWYDRFFEHGKPVHPSMTAGK